MRARVNVSQLSFRRESCTKMLLLHEMAHIKLRKRKMRDVHGREFQHEMQRLARIGAFRDLW